MGHKVEIILYDTSFENNVFTVEEVDITNKTSIGASIHDRFAEELDTGRLEIAYSEREKEYNRFDKIAINIYDDQDTLIEINFLMIEGDEVTPITKFGKRYFKHNLRLIEITHKLDQEVVNSLSFTQPIISIHRAPFEQEYEVYANFAQKTIREGWENQAILRIPKLEIKNYMGSPIVIDKVDKAIMYRWNSGTNEYVEVSLEDIDYTTNFHIVLEVFNKDGSEYFSPHQEFVISDEEESPVELTLPDGQYIIRYGVKPFGVGDLSNFFSGDAMVRQISYHLMVSENNTLSMKDVLEQLINTVPLEKNSEFANTRLCSIDGDLLEVLGKITAPQLLFQELTFREACNIILKYTNAVARLMYDVGTGYTLNANFFNKRKDLYSIDKIFAYNTEVDTLNYATQSRAFLKNTVSSNNIFNPSMTYPANSAYAGLRPIDIQLLPENGKLILPEPIYRIIKVEAIFKYNRAWDRQSVLTPTPATAELFSLDITPRIVEEAEYDIKLATNDIFGSDAINRVRKMNTDFLRSFRVEHAKYNYLGNIIDFTGTVGEIIPELNLTSVIYASLAEELSFQVGVSNLDVGAVIAEDPQIEQRFSRIYLDRSVEVDSGKVAKDIGFRVQYISMSKSVQDAEKSDVKSQFKHVTKIVNQNDKIVNYFRASVNNYGVAQRYGVPTVKYSKITEDIQSLEKTGDYNEDNLVVVERERILQRDYTVANYEASKDFQRLSKFVGIDREYRPYEIPDASRTFKRLDIFKDYLEYEAIEHKLKHWVYIGIDLGISTAFELSSPPATSISEALELITFMRPPHEWNRLTIGRVDGAMGHPDYYFEVRGFSEEEYEQHDTFISNRFLETFMNTAIKSEEKASEDLSCALVRTDGFLQRYEDGTGTFKALLTPVIGTGGKNELSFTFGWNHNQRAGDQLKNNFEVSLTSPFGSFKEAVLYTDGQGSFEDMDFLLLSRYNDPFDNPTNIEQEKIFDKTSVLPFVDLSMSDVEEHINPYILAETKENSEWNPLKVFKDPSSEYMLKYQISLTPANETARDEVIIGRMYCKNNFLVTKERDKNVYLYRYTDNTTHYIFDDETVKEGTNTLLVEGENCELLYFGRVFTEEIFTNMPVVLGEGYNDVGNIVQDGEQSVNDIDYYSRTSKLSVTPEDKYTFDVYHGREHFSGRFDIFTPNEAWKPLIAKVSLSYAYIDGAWAGLQFLYFGYMSLLYFDSSDNYLGASQITDLGTTTAGDPTEQLITVQRYEASVEEQGTPIGIKVALQEGTTSWAIGDEDGNLYFACNSNKEAIVFSRTHKRTTIQYDW